MAIDINSVRSTINSIYKERPGKNLVNFQVTAIGGPNEPWSEVKENFGFKSHFPNKEIWDNWTWAKGENNFPLITDDCDRKFGLGSAYYFISSTGTPLYIGRAGDASIASRIFSHLRKPSIIKDKNQGTSKFRWDDNKWLGREGSKYIADGDFYVIFITNIKPFQTFPNPYKEGYSSTNPYILISQDLEAHIAQEFGLPCINKQDVTKHKIRMDLPWGKLKND